MNEVSAAFLVAFCQSLKIVDQTTGAVKRWTLNAEQHEVIRAVCGHSRLIILKSRQVGITTVLLAYDLLFAIINPGLQVSIVFDIDENAKRKLEQLKQWCRQLKIRVIQPSDKHTLTLWNGAQLVAMTSGSRAADGEAKVGRSGTSGLIHASELSFWVIAEAAFTSLTATTLATTKVIVESTAKAGESHFRTMWDRANAPSDGEDAGVNRYAPLFLPLEMHEGYRIDPRTISDELWERLQRDRGFARRDTAAWWWSKLQGDFSGDVHRCLQEYPVKADDAFSFGKGRWIFGFQSVEPQRHVGDWRLYIMDAAGEPLGLGVDTALGLGRDSSAIFVMGLWSGACIATYKCNTIRPEDYANEVFQAQRMFKAHVVAVETNGCGKEVFVQLSAKGCPGLFDQKSSDIKGEKAVRMGWMKRAIESGRVLVGPELKAEIEGSVRDEEGDFDGPDDLLNAGSFIEKWRLAHPMKRPGSTPDPRLVYVPRGDAERPTMY
jgi:hypothetical protein